MKNRKLVQVFNSLDNKEVKKLQHWIKVELDKTGKEVLKLLDFLVKERKKKLPKYLKEQAFKQVFPTRPYKAQQLYQICSDLFKLIEKFLAFQEMEKDNSLMLQSLAKAYRQKNLEQQFVQTTKSIEVLLNDKQPYRDDQYWQKQFAWKYDYCDYIESQERSVDTNLQDVFNTFETYMVASQIKQLVLMYTHQNVYQTDYNTGLSDVVIEYIGTHTHFLAIPAISIYYYYYKAMNAPENPVFFQKMHQLLQENSKIFPIEETRNLYALAANYCIRKSNKGETLYTSLLLSLYESGLKDDILLDNGIISQFHYKNIVVLALKIKNVEKAKELMQEYKDKLHLKDRQDLYNLCFARISFYEGNFKEAMYLLSSFNSKDPLLFLDAKYILLKTYYELEELSLLDSLLDSMSQYVKRKAQIPKGHQNYYKQVLKVTKNLLNLPFSKTEKQAKKITEEIEQIRISDERMWFLHKLNKHR